MAILLNRAKYIWCAQITIGAFHFANHFRVVLALVMASVSTGRSASFAPDAHKAREAAKHIFDLLDRKPHIENCADDAKFPVRACCQLKFHPQLI